MNKNISIILAAFTIIFTTALSADPNVQCKLSVETINLDAVNQNKINPQLLQYLNKYKRGVNIVTDYLPAGQSKFKVVIERPIFKGGFLGYSYESSIRQYTITKEEMIQSQKPFGSDFPIVGTLVSAGYLPGEKINFGLFAENNELVAQTTFIPNPLERTFSDGKAKILIKYLGGEASHYRIYFVGFKEDEEIVFSSISGPEELGPRKLNIKNMMLGYSNGVIGANGGRSIVTFQRDSGEKVVFVLPWGTQLIPYLEGKVAFGELP